MLYTDGDSFDVCEGYSVRDDSAEQICLMSQDEKNPKVSGTEQYSTNPVRIVLTKEEAERATSVEATWVTWAKQDKIMQEDN